MSINSINYKKNKIIFNDLINKDYKIKKDSQSKNKLIITTSDKIIKCNYILLLIEKKINNKDSLIIWSDFNPYIDQYTRHFSKIVRFTLKNEYILDYSKQIITKKNLEEMIKKLIKHQYNFIGITDHDGYDNYNSYNINCNWILTNKESDMIEYYMITDIIYY